MNKKAKTLLTSVLTLAILIGGYFAVVKPGSFSQKNSIEYIKENNSSDAQENQPNDNQQDMEGISQGNNESDIKKDEIIKNETIAPLPSPTESPAPRENKSDSKNDNVSKDAGKIVDKMMTSGFKQSSGRKIDTIIIHTSYNAIGEDPYDVNDVIKQYEQYEVSAHYLIARNGTIYRLVKDQNIAWHAGVSKMPDGRTNVNDFSIGIEVINTKEGKFSDAEYGALNDLIASLKEKYPIKNILGHEDIAPGRKTDPWGIDWKNVDR